MNSEEIRQEIEARFARRSTFLDHMEIVQNWTVAYPDSQGNWRKWMITEVTDDNEVKMTLLGPNPEGLHLTKHLTDFAYNFKGGYYYIPRDKI